MSVRRSLIWSLSGQFYSMLMLFGGTVVIARILTPAEMGVYAVGFAVAGVFNIFATVGINSYVIREPDLDADKLQTAFGINVLLYLALGAGLVALSWPVAKFLGDEGIGTVLRLLAIRPLFLILEFRPSAMLQREMRFGSIAPVQAFATTINVGVMLAAAYLGWSYLSLAFGVLAGAVAGAAAYNIVGREHVNWHLGFVHWRPLLQFSLRILSISGLALMAQRLSEIVLARILGLAALGTFTRATQIWDLLYFNLYAAASRVLFAQLAEEYRRSGHVGTIYLRGLDIITAIMWPAAMGVAVLAGPIIFLLFGEDYMGAAGPLALLMIGMVFATAFSMNWEMFVIHDETARQTKLESVRAVVMLAAFTAGCYFGLEGAAGGRIAECAVGAALYLPSLARLSGTSARQYATIFGRSAVLALMAVIPAISIMSFAGWSYQISWILLACCVVFGVIFWSVGIVLFRHLIVDEFRHALQSVRKTAV